MKKLFSLLLAVILILPMGACAEGGGTMANYLTFASAEPFTIAVNNATKNWDGTLYYSTDAASWNDWDGTMAIASALHGGEHKIYMRGSNNSFMTSDDLYDTPDSHFVINGTNVSCTGNIETLLDYETVANGEHPIMADLCFCYLFRDCDSLITAPELPATVLSNYCYRSMFDGCRSLIKAPELPATKLNTCCYERMFYYCSSLTNAPELPASELGTACYRTMFYGCNSLTSTPKLPATKLAMSCYEEMFQYCRNLIAIPELPATTLSMRCYRVMFNGCTSLKLSTTQSDEYPNEYRIPTSGTGTEATDALTDMFATTGGTFTGTPSINTTYYTSNRIVSSDEETPQASVQYNELTATSFTAYLFTQGLRDGKEYTAEFTLRPKEFNSEIPGVVEKIVTFTGSAEFSVQSCKFTGLLPNTTYIVNVDLYPSDGSEGIIARDCEVTTLDGEIPVVGYDRDSFLLGFASSLGCTAATKDGVDYNTWTQGYIVGSALRKAL